MKQLRAFIREQDGITAIEYGFIFALVAIAIIGSLTAMGLLD